MPVAVVTGATRGFGRALTAALVSRGWSVVVDARRGADLAALAGELGEAVVPVAGDVGDAEHRSRLAGAARSVGPVSLLVNNASVLGPSPQPQLHDYPLDILGAVLAVNVVAPVALVQLFLPDLLATTGTVVNLSSDAAVEAYPGWGGYGASKAALDRIGDVLAVEHPELRVYGFDPGDMRTDMHQQAFPGEDISDRPEPETVVPALLTLLDTRPESGRYRAADLPVTTAAR